MRTSCLGALAVLGLLGCRNEPDCLTDGERVSIAREVDRLRSEAFDAAENLDVERLAGLFSRDSDAMFAGGGSVAASHAALEARYTGIMGGLRSQTIELGRSRIAVLGRDAAVVTAQGRVTRVDTAGVRSQGPFAWTLVWVRRNGEWKILHANQSYPPLTSMVVRDTI